MDSVKTDDQVVAQKKSRKWLLGAVFSFLIPFLLGGFLAENWSAERGREDSGAGRWFYRTGTVLPVHPLPFLLSQSNQC
jgi:hypothetical protein